MGGRSKKSKKRSAASSSPPEPTFFVDRAVGLVTVPEGLRALGFLVVLHSEFFAPDAADEDWLPVVAAHGLVVLTRDQRIRYRPAEIAAVQSAGVKMFALTMGSATGEQMVEALRAAKPAMIRILRKQRGAFIATVTRGGDVTVRYTSG